MTGNPNHDDKGKFAAGSGDRGFAAAKAHKEKLDSHVSALGKALNAFPKGAMGMTPEGVKASAEFKKVKAEFDGAFSKLREFNGKYSKVFKAEIKTERMNRRK